MDTRTFRLEIKALDDAQGTFDGYASTFGNQDAYHDVVEPGAFTNTLAEGRALPILWQHNPDEPIGVILEASEDPLGLRVKGQLVLDAARGRESYALLKAGVIRGLSIGFETVRYTIDAAQQVRRLQEIRLWECSLVTFPANPRANVSAVKSRDPGEAAVRETLRAMRADVAALGG